MLGPYGLGRIEKVDPRDLNHLLSATLPVAPRPKRITWSLKPRLNQGDTPACTGYSAKAFLLSRPVAQKKGGEPLEIYHEGQKLDGMTLPHEGSTVRAIFQYLTDVKKVVKSYKWAFTLEDVLNAMGLKGPVVAGTDWKTEMFTPDKDHIIRNKGRVEGGHAYLLLGYDDHRGLILIHNSWGEDWPGSDHGRAWIPYEDFEALLVARGEACMALEK